MVSCSDRQGLASGRAPHPPLLVTHLCIPPQNQWADPSLRLQPWIKSGLVESPLGSASSLGPAFCRQQGPVKLKCLVSIPWFLESSTFCGWMTHRKDNPEDRCHHCFEEIANQQWAKQMTSFSSWRRDARGCCRDALCASLCGLLHYSATSSLCACLLDCGNLWSLFIFVSTVLRVTPSPKQSHTDYLVNKWIWSQ